MNVDGGLGLAPIENKDTLIQQVYDELCRALLTGAFRPGQRITVREVAEAMGVSTTPAREALGRITADGGLEYTGPKTMRVPVLSRERFDELQDVRIALESLIAGPVTENADAAFIDRLEAINRDFAERRREGNFKETLEKNMEFHFAIYEISRKPFVINLLRSAWLVSGPAISLLYPKFSTRRSGVTHHRSAIKGLREKDADLVRDALIDDIRTGYGKIRSLLEAD